MLGIGLIAPNRMGLLEIVDNKDEIIGEADFLVVHAEGLRHRSVQVLVFDGEDYNVGESNILIAQRAKTMGQGALKYGPSVGGHVKKGQSYLQAARCELREELFFDSEELPPEIKLDLLWNFKNDTRPTNKENSRLYATVYTGDFSLDPAEVESISWRSSSWLREDIQSNPGNDVTTLRTIMAGYFSKFE